MNINEIFIAIEQDLKNRNLKSPNIRLNAMEKIKSYLQVIGKNEEIISFLQSNKKKESKEFIEKIKKKPLNGAELSILNELYYRL